MRVISGKAGRLKLITPEGMDVRPTTDRIKETLFNILSPYVYGTDFLDLFAGSGGIGIEALSRGAVSCVFVDNFKESERCVRKNLETTRLGDTAEFMFCDAAEAIGRLYRSGKRFDIIFMDPPYNCQWEQKVLERLKEFPVLKEDGMIIVEASADTGFDYAEDLGFTVSREKSYGSNKHVFLKWSENE